MSALTKFASIGRTSPRRPWRWPGLALWLLVAGCGGPDRPPTVPVSGQVTFGGQLWPKPGMLSFLPDGPKSDLPRRAGTAPFDVDGNFRAGTFAPGDGLIPGSYQVRVECSENPPGLTANPPPKSFLPASFLNAPGAGWTLRVEPGSKPIEVHYDVPKE